jgi:hypothetical protein
MGGSMFKWNNRRSVILMWLTALLLICNFTLTVKTTIWTDPVTGSRKSQTKFLFLQIRQTREISPLQTWMDEHHIAYQQQWQFLARSGESLFGRTLMRGCGSAPPNYSLLTFMEDYLKLAGESQIRELIHILQTGTQEQQQAAVDQANKLVLDKWDSQTSQSNGM